MTNSIDLKEIRQVIDSFLFFKQRYNNTKINMQKALEESEYNAPSPMDRNRVPMLRLTPPGVY